MGILTSVFGFLGATAEGFLAADETRKIVLSDSGLLLYPILAVIVAVVLFVVLMALVLASSGALLILSAGSAIQISVLNIFVGLVITYVIIFYSVLYFTTAMLIAFKQFTRGTKIGIISALSETGAYSVLLLEWTIFYLVVVTLINALEAAIRSALSRFGAVGNIISSIILGIANIALNLSMMFVLPIIIEQKTGPVATLKQSASFIMKSFGETFGGLLYSDIWQWALAFVGAIFIFLGVLAIASSFSAQSLLNATSLAFMFIIFLLISALSKSPAGSVILIIGMLVATLVFHTSHLGVVALILIFLGVLITWTGHLLQFVFFNTYRLLIYDYKTSGSLPKGFNKSVIDGSIKRKVVDTGTSMFGGGTGGGSSTGAKKSKSSGGYKDPFEN